MCLVSLSHRAPQGDRKAVNFCLCLFLGFFAFKAVYQKQLKLLGTRGPINNNLHGVLSAFLPLPAVLRPRVEVGVEAVGERRGVMKDDGEKDECVEDPNGEDEEDRLEEDEHHVRVDEREHEHAEDRRHRAVHH